MLAYGPVPSRRLGRSLGINNIPAKNCTYACAYCQVGHTLNLALERREFYRPDDLVRAVSARFNEVIAAGDTVDYLCFVPDGEPTLDVHLGEVIGRLRELGRPVGVISNSSLLDRPEVRQDLAQADWVSVKVDAADEESWRRLNHPHPDLELTRILSGITAFAREFRGTFVTETMLVAGVNDSEQSTTTTAAFLSTLRPSTAYLAVPTRPPVLSWVKPPCAADLLRCFITFEKTVANVEYLLGYEGNAFAATGDPVENLLSITAVHPMREDSVAELLRKAGASWDVVAQLTGRGRLHEVDYAGYRYYVRRPPV